jgi:hypothetical protein
MSASVHVLSFCGTTHVQGITDFSPLHASVSPGSLFRRLSSIQVGRMPSAPMHDTFDIALSETSWGVKSGDIGIQVIRANLPIQYPENLSLSAYERCFLLLRVPTSSSHTEKEISPTYCHV